MCGELYVCVLVCMRMRALRMRVRVHDATSWVEDVHLRLESGSVRGWARSGVSRVVSGEEEEVVVGVEGILG